MNIQNKIKTVFSLSVVLFIVALFTGSLHAEAVVYEPFDYAAGALDGQDGGDGFDGAWITTVETVGDETFEVVLPGLTFNDGAIDLPVAGGATRRPAKTGKAVAYRSLSAASTLALTADDSTMWFSAIHCRNNNNETMTLALATSYSTIGVDATLATAGYGVGFKTKNSSGIGKVAAAVYNNSTAIQTSAYNDDLLFEKSSRTYLLACKVNFKSDGTPDELFLFNITDLSTEPDEADAIASITVDIPLASQQALGIISISDGQTASTDEIRFGTTFKDAIGIELDETAPYPVKAGKNMITWSGRYVPLLPTATNNDEPTPLTYEWTASPSDGVVFSDTDTSSSDIKASTVTITNASTSNPTTYTLTFAVNNEGSSRQDVLSVMTIDVYDDACKAAKGAGLTDIDETDFNANCVTGLEDFAQMAMAWLVDYSLTGPVPR